MAKNNKINRIISIIILLVISLSFILSNYTSFVYAEQSPTANKMGAKMIDFFQSKDGIEMSQISEAELRVYGVFVSNFFTPGNTQIKDLSLNSTNTSIRQKISSIFFGGDSSNDSKITELNNIVYKGITTDLLKNILVDESGKEITGQDLIQKMVGKGNSTKVYRAGNIGVIDFSDDAFRGVFKILAAQSAEFMLGRDFGIPAMTKLYIDPFGNIWGAYSTSVISGDKTFTVNTPVDDLHLVLPAALNPLSFYNTSRGADFSKTKLPLHNSFAMGSIIADGTINKDLEKDFTGYYNIPYFFNASDNLNSLYIYGLNTPFNYLGKTDTILTTNFSQNHVKDELTKYIGNKTFDTTDNLTIVLGNRFDVMDKTLQSNANSFFDFSGTNYLDKAQLYQLYEYLFGSQTLTIDKTLSDIYYFADSGDDSWADNTFSKLGLIGINMYGKEIINDSTKEGTGVWNIHSSDSQVLSYIARQYVDNKLTLEETSIKDINKKLGKDEWVMMSDLKPGISQELNVYKSPIAAWFSGKKYVHNLSDITDKWIYNRVTMTSTDVITNEINNNVMYHTQHTYGVVGAKINATKTRESQIVVNKTESVSGNLLVMNDRVDTANWPGIFWGYMVEMLDMKASIVTDDDGEVVNYNTTNFYSQYLPKLPSGLVSGSGGINLNSSSGTSGVANSENKSEEDIKKDLLKRLYGLTTDGPSNYRDNWIKSSLDGFILSTHRAITGSWLADVATVSSAAGSTYSSVVGYLHIPSLYELPFTSWIMTNYMQIYVFSLLFIFIVTIFMVLLNIRTWKQGLLILMIMSFVLLIPNILVENTINIGNKVTDSIYSDRFDFWALTQHQQSVNRIKGAEISTSDMDKIITNTGEKVQNIYSQDAGVRVKWMAPKKDGTFDQLFNSKYLGDSLATNLTIFRWLFSSFIYEQEFVSNDPLATYMYRPYNSIARDAQEYFDFAQVSLNSQSGTLTTNGILTSGFDDTAGTKVPLIIEDLISKTASSTYEKNYTDLFIGSAYWFDKTAFTKINDFEIFWSEPQMLDIVEKGSQYPNYKLNPEKRTVSLWGLGSDSITNTILEGGSFRSSDRVTGIQEVLLSPLDSNTDGHLVAFYKNTESPYYYFYSTLKSRYGQGVSFKSSLIESNIFQTKGIGAVSTDKNTNNMVRDFLDMEGLFTNIIPYMTVANNYVYEWTKINGTSVPDFNFSGGSLEGSVSDETLGVNSSEVDLYDSVGQQYLTAQKQREDMEKVWMMYTPWVDQINSLSTTVERVKFGNSKVTIGNTLNPSQYLQVGRPMLFSEVDMTLKGYSSKDLTDIEIRIQKVLTETHRDLMYLVNYYDLEDEVLLNAAAMYATFNFNREFSETSLIGESVMLYPQSFEMKNFNYDAFMRMIMLNATGESVFGSQDLYVRILAKTSWFTGIMLLLVDVLAVIMIPTMKIIILLMLLFLSILLCITTAVSPPEKVVNIIFKSLVLPTLLFLVSNIVFAWIVSLLVGEGLTNYVGSRGVSIVTNDPTITIGLLILMSIAYVLVMWKTILLLFSSLKSYGMAGIFAGIGIIGGAVSTGVKRVGRKATGLLESTGGAITGGVTGAIMSEKGERTRGAISGASVGRSGRSVFAERSRERRMTDAMNKGNSNYMKNKIEEKSSTKNEDNTDNRRFPKTRAKISKSLGSSKLRISKVFKPRVNTDNNKDIKGKVIDLDAARKSKQDKMEKKRSEVPNNVTNIGDIKKEKMDRVRIIQSKNTLKTMKSNKEDKPHKPVGKELSTALKSHKVKVNNDIRPRVNSQNRELIKQKVISLDDVRKSKQDSKGRSEVPNNITNLSDVRKEKMDNVRVLQSKNTINSFKGK